MEWKEILKAIDPKAARIKELEEQVESLTKQLNKLKESQNGADTREKSKRRSNKTT
jgi:prefoldin subunit 5